MVHARQPHDYQSYSYDHSWLFSISGTDGSIPQLILVCFINTVNFITDWSIVSRPMCFLSFHGYILLGLWFSMCSELSFFFQCNLGWIPIQCCRIVLQNYHHRTNHFELQWLVWLTTLQRLSYCCFINHVIG